MTHCRDTSDQRATCKVRRPRFACLRSWCDAHATGVSTGVQDSARAEDAPGDPHPRRAISLSLSLDRTARTAVHAPRVVHLCPVRVHEPARHRARPPRAPRASPRAARRARVPTPPRAAPQQRGRRRPWAEHSSARGARTTSKGSARAARTSRRPLLGPMVGAAPARAMWRAARVSTTSRALRAACQHAACASGDDHPGGSRYAARLRRRLRVGAAAVRRPPRPLPHPPSPLTSRLGS